MHEANTSTHHGFKPRNKHGSIRDGKRWVFLCSPAIDVNCNYIENTIQTHFITPSLFQQGVELIFRLEKCKQKSKISELDPLHGFFADRSFEGIF